MPNESCILAKKIRVIFMYIIYLRPITKMYTSCFQFTAVEKAVVASSRFTLKMAL